MKNCDEKELQKSQECCNKKLRQLYTTFTQGYTVIYDRVRNRKNYFEITAFLNIIRGTSRVGNSNENKNTNKYISSAAKCNITLNFPAPDIPHSIGREAGIS